MGRQPGTCQGAPWRASGPGSTRAGAVLAAGTERGWRGPARPSRVLAAEGLVVSASGPQGWRAWSASPRPSRPWSPLGVEGPPWVFGTVMSAEQPVSNAGVDLALSAPLASDLGPAAAAPV